MRSLAKRLLLIDDPREKALAVRQVQVGDLEVLAEELVLAEQDVVPGRLEHPLLVHPSQLVQRSVATKEGHAALVHSLCHIELNAVDLALDILWRFPGLPDQFYVNWWNVAREEALHFTLLSDHLNSLGYEYGQFPAHDGLWAMAERTKDDLLARLVMVPMLLEARGLDVSPPIRARLASIGDKAGASILDIILRDEIGHVAVGLKWFRWVCHERGLDEEATVAELRMRHGAPKHRGQMNLEARRSAGFTDRELKKLVG